MLDKLGTLIDSAVGKASIIILVQAIAWLVIPFLISHFLKVTAGYAYLIWISFMLLLGGVYGFYLHLRDKE